MKINIKTLKNGLKLILVEDKTKNATSAKLIVKYGSLIKNIIVDGKEYEITPGLAHLLEHAMIEDSLYGNICSYFRENYVYSNGYTSEDITYFPIETIKDFKKYLKVLIEYVNKVSFKEENLVNIKKPVIDEIIRSKDRSYYKFQQVYSSLIHNNTHFENTLGNPEEVQKITTDDLLFVHDAFYQPSNEILAISGNFDTEDIIEYVEEIYDNLNISKKDVKVIDKKDDITIKENKIEFTDDSYDPLAAIMFKFDLKKFNSLDLLKLDYYISFFLDYYFSENSFIQKNIFENKLSTFSVNKNIRFMNKEVLCLSVSLITEKFDDFFSLVDNKIKEKCADKEYFELWKRNSLIGIIKRNKEHCAICGNLTNNILMYDYYENEDISFIENLNFDEYNKFMEMLDFNNKTYIIQTKSVNK